MINNELYRNSVTKLPQRCISEEEGRLILQDIHSGECRHHASSQTLVAKAFRAGFFWPNALRDAKNIVDHCRGCQFYTNRPHKPASELKTIPLAWPFAVWGLNMIGPLRTGKYGFTHILVAVDKFTKWIEAKPIKALDSATSVSFIQGIIHRFCVPHDKSQTMGQISTRLNSRNSVGARASRSILPQLHTHSPMAKSSEQID